MPTPDHRFSDYTALLAGILRGDAPPADAFNGIDIDAFRESAITHDVLPLVADALGERADVPVALRSRLTADARAAIAVDLLREAELARLVTVLSRHQVTPIIMKGSHLAYTHYRRPDLRPRIDSDIVIPLASRQLVDRVLTSELGYVASAKVSGDLYATQNTYSRFDHDVATASVDVHWRLTNPQVFAHVLTYDDLLRSSEPLPALGPSARVPSSVHALLIACVHRIAHHDDAEELKWFVDIDRVAARLSAPEWEEFVGLAAERRVGAVCRHSLARCVELLHTPIPDNVLADERLQISAGEALTAAYLKPRPMAQVVVDDLRALDSWRDRFRLIGEHLFPSADYMRSMYAPGSRLPLPLLYSLRIARGAGRWLGISRDRR